MFLPEKVGYTLPLIPNINKENIGIYSALVGCFVVKKVKFRFLANAPGARTLVIVGLLTSTFTVFTNLDPVFTGVRVKPALNPQDVISMTLQMAMFMVPFVLGALLVKNASDGTQVLKLVAIAGIIYSPLMILEVLLSPQLHTWIYGFFPHSFGQQERFGGYRPVVFMGHGLVVAIFAMATLISVATLWKAKQKILLLPNFIYLIYSLFLVIICKSVGAWILGFLGLVIIIFLPARMIGLAAFGIAGCVFLYPILSIFELIPKDSLLELALKFGPDKAGSLAFRFGNEEIMLEHGKDKILFGWGGWDRNRIDGVVTDGYWIIRFTQFGLLGYLVAFGLPMLAVKNGLRSMGRSISSSEKNIMAGFCLLISMILVDQIPNASVSGWIMFIYGAATGFFANRSLSKNSSKAMISERHARMELRSDSETLKDKTTGI
ncbi:hypothetical protein [Microbulbifer hydrolyticus]|uniref:O-antigen ligase domain-containing protein n=1 Tax=Microbulbifer hydrolyticus TaxID=48074 RepID=A0A6P1TFE8_9GAMM|nr:hypothetical protein [Microbulbifer hydrolyticus]MBB5211841.1 hypothetical protein [Microbulbifer hydrolyticus]QHQ40571.1 hypothetical protein GTQ55_17355 [Microbulbifer hydrolyticus]